MNNQMSSRALDEGDGVRPGEGKGDLKFEKPEDQP